MTDQEKAVKKLNALFDKVPNRAAFAKQWGIPGGASMVYQHLRGLKPISLKAALLYAKAFGVSVDDINPQFKPFKEKFDEHAASVLPLKQPEASDLAWVDQTKCELAKLSSAQQATVRLTIEALIKALKSSA